MAADEAPTGTSKRGRPKKPADPNAPVPMTFRVPPQVRKAVRHAAIEEERLVQDIITDALVDWLMRHGHEKGLFDDPKEA
ncbi:hypothetical protein [Georgenia yuyongxinii]